jgi:DNA mismatch repair protein MutS
MAASNRLSLDHPPPVAGATEARTSILFDRPQQTAGAIRSEQPSFFADLNLDQVVGSITADRDDYDLEPFFYSPLCNAETVRYRHEALRDLERDGVRDAVEAFAERMRVVRRHLKLADEFRYRYEKQRLFLDGAGIYCEAASALAGKLDSLEFGSRGFRALRDHLVEYRDSEPFVSLAGATKHLQQELAMVMYSVDIRGNRVTVDDYGGEPDYSAKVEETFERFQQGAVKDYRARVRTSVGLDHVEAQVLELVAKLHPELFAALDEYRTRHVGFLDPTLAAFDREVQFYLAYLEHIEPLQGAGLPFCYPQVSSSSNEMWADDAFDLALANVLVPDGGEVVLNGFRLEGAERIIVVSGPNQGGKTTFARMFGELHHLAALGLPVPARDARLTLADEIFTHFEREEEIANLRGKLEDDLVRVHEIIEQASAESVLVLNESFASTTLDDALFLGTELIARITALGSLAVYVTFVDELASLNEATVSMVATVDPQNPAERTHRVVRRPADGLAYASAIAEKHGLTYETLRRRVGL